MGRWTPLILMAGGLAILLGTLVGIGFPINGQNTANNPGGRKASSVLPANINVNSTNTKAAPYNENRGNVAQNNPTTNDQTSTNENNQEQTTDSPAADSQPKDSPSSNTGSNNEPIRALW
jgi:hypothetical protein